MERCVFCQAEVEAGSRRCRACGREQPAAPIAAGVGAPLAMVCPSCHHPAEPDDRFCNRCAYPLRQSCRVCQQEAPIWARFCPNCANPFPLPGAAQEKREERQGIIGLVLPESAPPPRVPGASAAPQTGIPSVPNVPGGPQTSVPQVPSVPGGPQTGMPGMPGAPGGSQTGTALRQVGRVATRGPGRGLLSTAVGKAAAVVVAVVVVVTGGTAIAAATGHNPLAIFAHHPAAAGGGSHAGSPPATEMTYIGNDGNIWEMTLPGNTRRQLTTDARQNMVSYSGLAWSPDGSKLAVERSAGAATELLLLTPDGKVTMRTSVSGGDFIWSPDGRSLAYRALKAQCDNSTGACYGSVVLVSAQTGAATKTITYETGSGCGGGGLSALDYLIAVAHHSSLRGIDSFSWSSDGQSLLVGFGCDNAASYRITLSNGTLTTGYPEGASFQPGGSLILGIGGNPNGLAMDLFDQSGKVVRTLASSSLVYPPVYTDVVGLGTWSSDGKTIYYEYQDGIWRINVDGSGAKQIIAGTPVTNGLAIAEVDPRISPDGKWLIYLKASGGAIADPSTGQSAPASAQWYLAHADGSGEDVLPLNTIGQQSSFPEVIWRPEK